MYNFGAGGAALRLDASGYFGPLGRVKPETRAVLSEVKALSAELLGAAGLAGSFIAAGKAAMGLGAELSNIKSIADQTNLSTLKTGLLSIDSVLGKTASLAGSTYFAVSSGVKGTESELAKFTDTIGKTNFTVKGEAIPTMDAITTTMNAYSLAVGDAVKVSDWYFKIIQLGKSTGTALASSLGNVAGTAAAAGDKLEGLGAGIATLTTTMPTAQAITSLAQIYNSFISPAQDALDVAAQYNIQMNTSIIKAKGLAGALEEIKQKTGGNVEVLAKLFTSTEALKGALALINTQNQTYKNNLKEFENASGAMLKGFAAQTDNAAAIWKRAMGDIDKGLIRVGDAIEPVSRQIGELVSWFGKTVAATDPATIRIGTLAAAMVLLTPKVKGLLKDFVMLPVNLTKAAAAMAGKTGAVNADTAALQANTAAQQANNAARNGSTGRNLGIINNAGIGIGNIANASALNADAAALAAQRHAQAVKLQAQRQWTREIGRTSDLGGMIAGMGRRDALANLYQPLEKVTPVVGRFTKAIGVMSTTAGLASRGVTALAGAFGMTPIGLITTAALGIVVYRKEIAAWWYDLDKVQKKAEAIDNRVADKQGDLNDRRRTMLAGQLDALAKKGVNFGASDVEQLRKDIAGGDAKRLAQITSQLRNLETPLPAPKLDQFQQAARDNQYRLYQRAEQSAARRNTYDAGYNLASIYNPDNKDEVEKYRNAFTRLQRQIIDAKLSGNQTKLPELLEQITELVSKQEEKWSAGRMTGIENLRQKYLMQDRGELSTHNELRLAKENVSEYEKSINTIKALKSQAEADGNTEAVKELQKRLNRETQLWSEAVKDRISKQAQYEKEAEDRKYANPGKDFYARRASTEAALIRQYQTQEYSQTRMRQMYMNSTAGEKQLWLDLQKEYAKKNWSEEEKRTELYRDWLNRTGKTYSRDQYSPELIRNLVASATDYEKDKVRTLMKGYSSRGMTKDAATQQAVSLLEQIKGKNAEKADAYSPRIATAIEELTRFVKNNPGFSWSANG